MISPWIAIYRLDQRTDRRAVTGENQNRLFVVILKTNLKCIWIDLFFLTRVGDGKSETGPIGDWLDKVKADFSFFPSLFSKTLPPHCKFGKFEPTRSMWQKFTFVPWPFLAISFTCWSRKSSHNNRIRYMFNGLFLFFLANFIHCYFWYPHVWL